MDVRRSGQYHGERSHGGNGPVIKNGSGTLTLSNVNTYNAATTINGGIVNVNSSASLGYRQLDPRSTPELEISTGFSTTRSIVLGNAASTFQVDASQIFTDTTAISGSGSLNKNRVPERWSSVQRRRIPAARTSPPGRCKLMRAIASSTRSALNVTGGTFDVGTFSETVAAVTLASGSITGTGVGDLDRFVVCFAERQRERHPRWLRHGDKEYRRNCYPDGRKHTYRCSDGQCWNIHVGLDLRQRTWRNHQHHG